MAPRLPVRPELGPTLPELIGVRRFAVLAAVAIVLALVVLWLVTGGASGERTIVVERPVAFNLRHAAALAERPPRPGELLRLESARGEVMTVRELRLPAYRGAEAGILPLVADREATGRLARRFAAFELADEGRTRVNEAPGYGVTFRARRDGRRVYGRAVFLLPPESPGARTGLRVELLAPRSPAVPSAAAVGTTGALKRAYRTLRFGTETP